MKFHSDIIRQNEKNYMMESNENDKQNHKITGEYHPPHIITFLDESRDPTILIRKKRRIFIPRLGRRRLSQHRGQSRLGCGTPCWSRYHAIAVPPSESSTLQKLRNMIGTMYVITYQSYHIKDKNYRTIRHTDDFL